MSAIDNAGRGARRALRFGAAGFTSPSQPFC